jgi:L-aminoadipate-semialdehyde dehydrogenase
MVSEDVQLTAEIDLEVSQPRALVQLARATDEAGPLAPIVREYIDQELQLKGEVPSLRIDDNGHLTGGDIDGKDVLTAARGKAEHPPDVIIGPDSNPTLSFTSGSEGKPKGVLGRHYSLAYYFGWMAERFQLSSASRYTLLSGIAHDPVQRDIFTPLFLGAQLLVPSKEDIQHEKLAEWMNKYKPTVTHLTPAMAQVLVGGATAKFDSLDRAFLVGDVLTTRDCRRLRDLAENVKIVNMYGTTETQRAVSYFEVPSKADEPDYLDKLKDTVPAGRGMKNVQLLVVNVQDPNKICGIGETGEIYVRAAGLAEGYKGDDEKTKSLNAEKFKDNWFVDNNKWVEADKAAAKNEPWRKYYKGPRDRMYRTGDLGRYLESGDVECTGRADDQVKIRGFRIELNEIDSNLSQHPLIRDCKTVVQRDRNEEPTLVSYIVVELSKWPEWLQSHKLEDTADEGIDAGATTVFLKRFRPLQAEVRDHLKGRLQIQAVPTTYIVLNKLPLNPNGKVDKPNLPFPDIAEAKEDATEEEVKRWNELTETERAVATIWAKLIPGLNEKSVAPENSFFDLGGHSLLAQQMLLQMRREVKANVSINTVYEHNTLRTFSKAVDRILRPRHSTNASIANIDESPYAKSLDELLQTLPTKYLTADPSTIRARSKPTVFLTGATGFLGAYIIKDILDRTQRSLKLIAHVRAPDEKAGLDRLKRSLNAYGLWQPTWESRISCVVGDLSKPSLGLSSSTWSSLVSEVDVIIHNGAQVHWVKRYDDMKAANVQSTVEAMRLCNEGKPKLFAFVSSTSVLDNDYYVKLSEEQVGTGQGAVLESDDMMGSKTGLTTGYVEFSSRPNKARADVETDTGKRSGCQNS